MAVERYVVDIGFIGKIFKNEIMKIVSVADHGREAIDYIYKESISQMVMILDNHLDDYILKLVALPDCNYFSHITELNDLENKRLFSDIFRECAIKLGPVINNAVNKENSSVEYLLESTSNDYVIVLKNYRRF